MAALGGRGTGIKIFEDLCRRYKNPTRAYHTLAHIKNSLNELKRVKSKCADPDSISMAVWFHDAIYNARCNDNEEESARLAKKVLLRAGVQAQKVKKIGDLVRATSHRKKQSNKDTQYIVDIDLASLGCSWLEFQKNGKKIRKEYAWLSDQEYKKGRVNFLKSIIRRPRLYYTSEFYTKYEKPARRNILKTIKNLEIKKTP